ncbi:MAG: hypothetical protein K8W52_16645 [Deltaproteobacteria bacterium]|nr:hypothetical protein [Deltaproteobacteria bacterium]
MRGIVLAMAIGGAVACHGDAPSSPAPVAAPPPVVVIGVRVDGTGATPVEIAAGASRDLWPLCQQYDAEAIVARGRSGAFVRAPCAHPAGDALALTTDGTRGKVALTRAADGARAPIASADDVIAIDIVRPRPPTPTTDDVGLTIVVPGKPPLALSGAAFNALVPAEHLRRGIGVAELLAAAKVKVDGDVIVTGGEPPYRIKAAWLRDRDQVLALRRNHRGQLRFEHTVGGSRRGHVKDVTALELVPR